MPARVGRGRRSSHSPPESAPDVTPAGTPASQQCRSYSHTTVRSRTYAGLVRSAGERNPLGRFVVPTLNTSGFQETQKAFHVSRVEFSADSHLPNARLRELDLNVLTARKFIHDLFQRLFVKLNIMSHAVIRSRSLGVIGLRILACPGSSGTSISCRAVRGGGFVPREGI